MSVAAGKKGTGCVLAVLDGAPLALARQAAAETGLATWAVTVPGLEGFSGEAYCLALGELARDWGARVILGAHTTGGMAWAPGLAGEVGGGVPGRGGAHGAP